MKLFTVFTLGLLLTQAAMAVPCYCKINGDRMSASGWLMAMVDGDERVLSNFYESTGDVYQEDADKKVIRECFKSFDRMARMSAHKKAWRKLPTCDSTPSLDVVYVSPEQYQ
jgi:hypothetical protein